MPKRAEERIPARTSRCHVSRRVHFSARSFPYRVHFSVVCVPGKDVCGPKSGPGPSRPLEECARHRRLRAEKWTQPLPRGRAHKSGRKMIGLGQRFPLGAFKPVFLESYDQHHMWLNSKALEMAGITKETPDPHMGRGSESWALPRTSRRTGMVATITEPPSKTPSSWAQGVRKTYSGPNP